MTTVVRRGAGRLLRVATVIAGVLLIALGGAVTAAPAEAHAQLIASTPADGATLEEAPDAIELRFNETVGTVADAYHLVSSDGTNRPLTAQAVDDTVTIALPGGLGDDDYLFAYRVVSTDGHPIAGTLQFTVGDGAPDASGPVFADNLAPTTPSSTVIAHAALTAVHYLALLVFAGLVFFAVVIARDHDAARSSRRGMLIATGAIAVATAALLIVSSALEVAGHSLGKVLVVGDWANSIQVPSVVVAAITLVAVGASLWLMLTAGRSALRAAAVVLAAVGVVSPALVGHSVAFEPVAVAMAADVTHLLVGAVWAGGLVGLLLLVRAGAPRSEWVSDEWVAHVEQAVRRFSAVAIWSIAALGATGALMAVLYLDSVAALVTTGYGLTLIVKLAVVGLIVVAGALNRLVVLPRIRALPTGREQWQRLRKTLGVESVLLILVLAVTGWLTTHSPVEGSGGMDATGAAGTESPVGAAPVPTDQLVHIEHGDLVVHGMFVPVDGNRYELSFMVQSPDGPIITDDPPRVEFSLPDENLGPIVADMSFEKQTSRYFATVSLPIAGRWQASIAVHVSKFEEPVFVAPVTVY